MLFRLFGSLLEGDLCPPGCDALLYGLRESFPYYHDKKIPQAICLGDLF